MSRGPFVVFSPYSGITRSPCQKLLVLLDVLAPKHVIIVFLLFTNSNHFELENGVMTTPKRLYYVYLQQTISDNLF